MTTSWRRIIPAATIAALALIATATSIGHDFTFDDRGVILENERVHSLAHLPRLFAETYWPARFGGDGYRPFVMSLFTLQWAAGHGAPWVFHAINILLAIATALAVYWCALAILPPLGAWVAGAFFAVHPVHVEVTGNIVGQSELIVALCVALAMGLYIRARRQGTLRAALIIAVAALFAVALLSKEHAIVLPALIVAADLLVVEGQGWRQSIRAARPLVLALSLVAVVYLLARGLVQEDITGIQPYGVFKFLHLNAWDRIGTMMTEVPRIGQLLVFPTKLSADYSPTDVSAARGFSPAQLPGLVICAGAIVLAVSLRRRAPVVSFGLWWLMIAFLPVSNLLVPAGFITAERTLFLPSVGVVLLAGAIAVYVSETIGAGQRRIAALALGVVLCAALARSIDRMRVWKNNERFFAALMRDAANGYRAHYLHALELQRLSRFAEMEVEYRHAIRIFPYDAGMNLGVADAYTRAGMCAQAVTLFEWTFNVDPEAGNGRYEYVYCLARLGRWKDAKREAFTGLSHAPPQDIKLLRAAIRDINVALAAPH
ncbi:MAG: tetratricopeptide repeat protein [Gemmatimonadota bacterium]